MFFNLFQKWKTFKIESADSIGEYTAYTLTAKAPSNISKPWNVPHLLVYGSLTPDFQRFIMLELLLKCNEIE